MPRHDVPTEIDPRPEPAPRRGPGATTAQLRRDSEGGATGDKVPMLDPAKAPLGTDDEAAGFPPTPRQVAEVRFAEQAAAPARDPGQASRPVAWRVAGALALLVAIGVAAALYSLG
jgi:hypothetical protein